MSASAAASSSSAPASVSGGGLARMLHVWCSVMSLDGRVEIHSTHSAVIDAREGVQGAGTREAHRAARALGEELGDMLLKKGADKLLEGIVGAEGTGMPAPASKANPSL